ncbi:uncharacterized protein A4U43_C07F16960 [Asparagus officinalis]|uniref:Uncharacterized protein n=1 Tax=Asparagus officinalis TaxID=4686 RepID=A0A5P1ECV8_ASPOF|nr:uncharacterized protein A4U43_C07F16960 [Asparagus officinalis]
MPTLLVHGVKAVFPWQHLEAHVALMASSQLARGGEGDLPISPVADPLVCPPKPTNPAVIEAPQNPSQPPPADLKGKRPMVAETPSPLVSSPPVEVEGNPDSVEVLLKGAKVYIDKSSWELFKSVFDAADYVLIDPPLPEGDKSCGGFSLW